MGENPVYILGEQWWHYRRRSLPEGITSGIRLGHNATFSGHFSLPGTQST
jgi:hypothetical protein